MIKIIITSSDFSKATNIFRSRPDELIPANAFSNVRDPTSIQYFCLPDLELTELSIK
jgi:hypothetical protein